LVAVVVLALVVAGAWFLSRASIGPGIAMFGYSGRGLPDGGRFFNMPRHFGMMPGVVRGIGLPYIGWVGAILVFAFGVAVGLVLGAIGRSPSSTQPSTGGTGADVPASFEAWHSQLHEQEAQRSATKRSRRGG
jgi:hypothetical protein